MLGKIIKDLLGQIGVNAGWQDNIAVILTVVLVFIFVIFSFFISRRILMPIMNRTIDRLGGDTLEATKVERPALASHIAHLVPAILLILLVQFFFESWPKLFEIASTLTWLYLYVFIGLALAGFVSLITAIFAVKYETSNVPYKVISQLIKLVTFIVLAILSVSLVLGSSPAYLLSGLGALGAVLILVFRDAILGFVASIQIAVNRMVAKGDWIEMPKYGADGTVIEVALTTVKVRNWDNTVTTLPTYALISDSFKNWRAMQQSGGRRIKRSILLDIQTIRFVTDEELEKLKQHPALKRFFAEQKAINLEQEDITNAFLFRGYIEWRLRQHPMINQRLTLMVRQLQSSEVGLPIEVYCFSADKNWVNYEKIQADIFDKLFAILPLFDLAPFQRITSRSDSGSLRK